MAYKVKKDPIDKIPKAQFVFWIIVRISMLVCAGYSFIHGDLVMGFESVFCFIFTSSLGYVSGFRQRQFY